MFEMKSKTIFTMTNRSQKISRNTHLLESSGLASVAQITSEMCNWNT